MPAAQSTDGAVNTANVPRRGAPLIAPGTVGPGSLAHMATVRLFAGARDAAGIGRDEVPGDTVGAVLSASVERYGDRFEAVLGTCKVWVNGEPATPDDAIAPGDELAVLPPVSGGCA